MEIIIDGVDVSSCKYYHYKGCSATGLRCENCTCYYKQLKRIEQENKNMKEELVEFASSHIELGNKYIKMVEISKENLIKYEDLRIDNQKLIMEIEGLNSQIDFEAQKQAILLQENEELKEQFEIETLKNNDTNECIYRSNLLNKYKHALEEIMGIANQTIIDYTEIAKNNEKLKALGLRNRMSNIQKIIYKAVRG